MEMVLRCVVSAVVSVVGKAVLEEAPGLFFRGLFFVLDRSSGCGCLLGGSGWAWALCGVLTVPVAVTGAKVLE